MKKSWIGWVRSRAPEIPSLSKHPIHVKHPDSPYKLQE